MKNLKFRILCFHIIFNLLLLSYCIDAIQECSMLMIWNLCVWLDFKEINIMVCTCTYLEILLQVHVNFVVYIYILYIQVNAL